MRSAQVRGPSRQGVVSDRQPGAAIRREFFDALHDADTVRLEIPIRHATREEWLPGALVVTASKTTGEITARIGLRTTYGKSTADHS